MKNPLQLLGHVVHARGAVLPIDRLAAAHADSQNPFLREFLKLVKKNPEQIDSEVFRFLIYELGLSEDQIFELVVSAAVGHGNDVYERGMDLLEEEKS